MSAKSVESGYSYIGFGSMYSLYCEGQEWKNLLYKEVGDDGEEEGELFSTEFWFFFTVNILIRIHNNLRFDDLVLGH